MIAGLQSGVHRFDPAPGPFTLIHRARGWPPGNRLNDATVAADGAIWFGSMDDAEQDDTGASGACMAGLCRHRPAARRSPMARPFRPMAPRFIIMTRWAANLGQHVEMARDRHAPLRGSRMARAIPMAPPSMPKAACGSVFSRAGRCGAMIRAGG
jgi:hypothetical protein